MIEEPKVQVSDSMGTGLYKEDECVLSVVELSRNNYFEIFHDMICSFTSPSL